ncbi:hypothetical protein RHCRD62_20410 [Rhodococcus sp. RD6.2]|nr:hypothetical protein RHCRD62_20410 [Rhodococcus sp. RD6.2]
MLNKLAASSLLSKILGVAFLRARDDCDLAGVRDMIEVREEGHTTRRPNRIDTGPARAAECPAMRIPPAKKSRRRLRVGLIWVQRLIG